MLNEAKKIFFLGVGGIGMSAIARYVNHKGIGIFGYDKTETELTKTLVREGVEITYTDDVSLIPDHIDLVIFTPAIPDNNRMYKWFVDSGIPMIKRSEALGLICQNAKTLAVAGTHGKTTTSSILSILLHNLGAKNSAFVGGIMNDIKSNFIYGAGEWIVVEADEYDRSFWRLYPDMAIILSMDPDHLDIYDTEDNVIEGFRMFTSNIAVNGILFIHRDLVDRLDHDWRMMLGEKNIEIRTFGLDKGDLYATDVEYIDGNQYFKVADGDDRHLMELQLLGLHNISNAVGAISVARELGYSFDDIGNSLRQFSGIHRRFEIVAQTDDKVLIDDYAHHPEELKVAILAARKRYESKKIVGVFQPHLFSRTNDFYREFAKELSALDTVILTDIYPAREEPMPGVSSQMIYELLEVDEKYLIPKSEIVDVLREVELDVLLVLGAGDIDKEVLKIKQYLFNE